MMGWVIYWVVILVIAVIVMVATSDADALGAVLGLGFIIMLLVMVFQWASKDDSPKSKLTPEIQATITALKEAKAQAEQLASQTPQPTPEPYKYGTEVWITPESDNDGGNNRIGEVICIEKMLVKGNVYTTDGLYYKIEPACYGNRKHYNVEMYVGEKAIKLWTEHIDSLPLCQCEGGY